MSYTNAQVANLIKGLNARLDALEAKPVPARVAPAKASAKQSEFVSFLHERAASKLPCAIHPASACSRRFSPKSSGGQNHLARLV